MEGGDKSVKVILSHTRPYLKKRERGGKGGGEKGRKSGVVGKEAHTKIIT